MDNISRERLIDAQAAVKIFQQLLELRPDATGYRASLRLAEKRCTDMLKQFGRLQHV